ncbi:MAG: alpha/beta fold hydrolase [Limisphaerales bacterium]
MNVVHKESDYIILGYSRGAEAALGYTLLHPENVDRLVIYAGFYNATVVNHVNSQRGSGHLADNPVPTVVISSVNDSLHSITVEIARSMARAHGFEGAPVRRPGDIDLNERPLGKDAYIMEYGPYVRHIISTAPSHEDTFVLSAEPGAGADTVNLGFIKNGILP